MFRDEIFAIIHDGNTAVVKFDVVALASWTRIGQRECGWG